MLKENPILFPLANQLVVSAPQAAKAFSPLAVAPPIEGGQGPVNDRFESHSVMEVLAKAPSGNKKAWDTRHAVTLNINFTSWG